MADEFSRTWLPPRDGAAPIVGPGRQLFPWTMAKAFLSSPAALAETIETCRRSRDYRSREGEAQVLPSLVAEDLRASLTSFLGTTFALGDDDVRAELERFVADPEHGVFRGPFIRLPFRPADEGWGQHLDWSPRGFRHTGIRRRPGCGWPPGTALPSPRWSPPDGLRRDRELPRPAARLDHCRRQRRAGQRGIKALVLYPMNALANDQARRVAKLVHQHGSELSDVTVGLYTGDSDRGVAMTETSVIADKYALRKNPPDILLTNYKMLDMLLLRSEDTPLFADAGESLQYLVLDEFHTYDGAQGTDVAMLLRRLGMALGVTTDERPLGTITPVATSATLGSGAEGGPAMREFAETVFSAEFDETSLFYVACSRARDELIVTWSGAPSPFLPLPAS